MTSLLSLLYSQLKNETLGHVPGKISLCIPLLGSHRYLTAFLIPCGVLAVPQTHSETWRNCTPDLHIFPELILSSAWPPTPSDPEETTPGLSRALGCPGCHVLAYRDGWDSRRGPGLSQPTRIHCQDPTSPHFSSREWGGSSSDTDVSALSRAPADNKYSTLCQVFQSPEDSGWNYISTESIKLYFGPASLSLTFSKSSQ